MTDAVAVSSALSDLVLTDPDGQQVRLGSLWASRPIVLVFVRHFG
jgi:hypothetical protein